MTDNILTAMAEARDKEFDRLISLHHNSASTMDIKLFRKIAGERAMAAACRVSCEDPLTLLGSARQYLTTIAEQAP
jgi:hypothetical protein